MKRFGFMAWPSIAVLLLTVAGCKKDENPVQAGTQPPPGVSNEVTAMQSSAASDPFVTNDEQTFADQTVQPADYGTFGKIDASIIPVKFGRFINRVDRTFTVTILPGDTLAVVLVDKMIYGDFAILAKLTPSDTSFTLIQKPFTDHATRNLVFKRINRDVVRFWLNWVPVATSLVEGKTVEPAGAVNFFPITITEVQMFTAGGDTVTVTDPDKTFLRFGWENRYHSGEHEVPILVMGDSVRVQVTVESASSDTDVVALRYGFGLREARRTQMHIVSESYDPGTQLYTRVFERTWRVHMFGGLFHAGIDAATHATIFDDSPTSYSVSWWGVPYAVRPFNW